MMGENIFRLRSVKAALLLSVFVLALIVVHRAELNSTTINQRDYEARKQSASSSNDLLKVKSEPVEAKKTNYLDQASQTRIQNSEADSPAGPQALPNLTPFQPSGWSDKIVVSNVTGTHVDSISLRPTDTLFVDWAAVNNGTVPVSAVFHTRLFVDGIDRGNWFTDPPLNSNFVTFVEDFSIGSLSVGNHTLRIVVDVLNEIAEDSEFDNEYTKFITVTSPGQPNVTPFQPSGWSDKIVVSNVAGTHSDSTLLSPTDTLFLDWAVINNGTAPVSTVFRIKLFVDGIEKGSWFSNPPLDTNFFSFVEDFSIGSLSAGTHALRIVADVFSEVAESNEFDNEYTNFVNINSGQPNLTPFQPSGWADKIVVSNVTGTHSDSSSLHSTDTLFVDWAAINNGAVPVSAVFHTKLFVDGIEKGSWFSNPPLATGFFSFVEDFTIGNLSAGNHTLRIVADVLNEVAESNEFDNEYSKTINVSSQQCFTLTVNVSPNEGGSFGRSSQLSCPGLMNVQEPDLVPQTASDLPAGTASLSGLSRTAAVAQAFTALISKAEADGSVLVIVELRAPFQPEGTLSSETLNSQRSAIERAQEGLTNQMSAANLRNIKRFKTIPYIAFEVDAAGLKFLENSPDVINIGEDKLIPPALGESVSLIGATNAWAAGYAGAGETVAILDTGVDKNHPFLAGKVVSEACFSTNSATSLSVCPGGVSQATSSGSGINCSFARCEHGTLVAGIVAGKGSSSSGVGFSGVARDSNIIAIQVFSRIDSQVICDRDTAPCPRSASSDQMHGLERVRDLASSFNIAAVNMSLGGIEKFRSSCDFTDPGKTAMRHLIDNLRSLGIATVIAAGNSGFVDGLSSPACISKAISVGSTGDGSIGTDGVAARDVVVGSSNSATFLNLLAPGKWILSSLPGGIYDNFSGTSLAAPHVAGAWAVLKSKSPSATVDQILAALTSTGVPVTDSRNNIVTRRIQVDAAVNALGGGSGSVSQYSSGATVTLTANPRVGFSFVKWQRDGADFSTSATVNVQMGSDHTMNAIFRAGTSSATTITSLSVDGPKKMNIAGSGFGLSPRVLINNVDRSDFITSLTDLSIALKGKRKKMGLRDGDNTVQVIGVGGASSNIAVLRL